MDNRTTINERISILIEYFGDGKNTKLASIIGSNEANIRGYSKNIMPKQDFLEKIVRNLDVNPDWLLTGDGEMIKKDPTPYKIEKSLEDSKLSERALKYNTRKANIYEKSVPLIQHSEIEEMFRNSSYQIKHELERYVIPVFSGADFLISIKGDAMLPKYSNGDIVACKNIPVKDLFFQWNKVYVFGTNQGAIINRIKPGSDKDHFLVVSDNEAYDPFELCVSSIHSVAIVIGVIRPE